MKYAPKGDARDKRTRGRCNTIGHQDNVIVIVVQSSPALSMRSTYSLSPVSSRLAEAKYRIGYCTTTGMRPSSLFLTGDADPQPDALNETMGVGYSTCSIVPYSTAIYYVPPPLHNDDTGVPFRFRHRGGVSTNADAPMR